MTKLLYQTELGKYYISKIEDFLISDEGKQLRGKVQLILTSPPFPLNNSEQCLSLFARMKQSKMR